MSYQVRVEGIDRVKRRLSPAAIGARLKPALRESATLVEAQAKRTVHVVSGRLQASLGQSDVRGSGIEQSIAVGTPYGRTGLSGSTFRRSSRSGPTKANTSDPNRYGPVEEFGYHGTQMVRAHNRRGRAVRAHGRVVNREGHPFLGPALEANRSRIVGILKKALGR